MRNFYRLYSNFLEITQQPAEQIEGEVIITQQLAEQIRNLIFSVPWGHHMYLIDKCSDNPTEALFYARETVKHGWSRSILMNMYGTDLFDRQGKGDTNFINTLPSQESDLAQEITRDPYCFGFTQLCEPYNERVLKDGYYYFCYHLSDSKFFRVLVLCFKLQSRCFVRWIFHSE